jgi:periplasmic copper chaperone A
MNRFNLLRGAVTAALLMAGAIAQAHVVLEQKQATVGSYYKAVFKVGHGCNGSATTGIRVFIPQGVNEAKPMPKPGWALSTVNAPLAKPHQTHGKTLLEDVSEVAWQVNPARGGQPLADAHYDEFVIQVRLPQQPGEVAFRILQTCEQGQNDWKELPKAGEKSKYPAAILKAVPAEHEHHQH